MVCGRCVHITDIGVGYISTMQSLVALYLRWCSQVRDFGVQHLCGMRSLQLLSLAGLFLWCFSDSHCQCLATERTGVSKAGMV